MATNSGPFTDGVASLFVQVHQQDVIGVLHGFDRLRLQGTLRSLYHPEVMVYYLRRVGVLWKDFKTFATGLTDRVRQAASQLAQTHRRPMIYLPGSSTSKEEIAREVAARDRLTSGLVAVLSCVEPCRTWFARGNRATQKLELKLQWGKCLHLCFYFLHEQLGWLHLRFLGPPRGPHADDEVKTDRRRREEGVRVKHWLNTNSQKFYDKGSVLRSENTINEPKDFRVWRGPENNPAGKKQWRILRRSVADLHRRAQVSRAACARHLDALAAVRVKTPLAQEAASVCRPVRKDGRRYRALNPLGETDAALLAVVNRGEYALNGFRNRDVRLALHGPTMNPSARRKAMGRVSRQLALLRAHGLVSKVSRTHRCVVTEKGRRVITALLAARRADTEQLVALAA